LSDTGVKIILVGIGLPAATTLPDSEDKSGKLHANGLLVQSRLEESGLKKMDAKLTRCLFASGCQSRIYDETFKRGDAACGQSNPIIRK
jgi:hypothetical protein